MNDALSARHEDQGAMMVIHNGVAVPASFGNAAAAHRALRSTIVLVDYSHFGVVEVTGEGAFSFLDRVLAGDLGAARDEQALYMLLLDEDGQIVTDAYVLCDDERYVLLCEWKSGAELEQSLRKHLDADHDGDVELLDLDRQHACFLLEGPYSWELAAELFGMDVLGLPFLEFMRVESGILLRCGKHGEFAYKVLVEAGAAQASWQRILELGAKYDLERAGLEIQSLARLENPCWDPNTVGRGTRCPIELQMQWAVRYDKEAFVGREAILGRLEQGVPRRLVGVVFGDALGRPVRVGDAVSYGDRVIGTVLTVGHSPQRGAQIGQALVEADFAYADLNGYEAELDGERVSITTSGVPFIRNFSFAVNPTEHSYVNPSRPKSLLSGSKGNHPWPNASES